MRTRQYTLFDTIIGHVDNSLRAIFGNNSNPQRPSPAQLHPIEETLDETQKRISGRLMRINHAGEVAAQGLYQGQSITARDETIQSQMRKAAEEENDHLAWCRERAEELGTHTSYLDPLWYVGSVVLGTTAGWVGDKWSLGFVAETERQVVRHLENHLQRLPENDVKSRAILEQMKIDEQQHAVNALEAGGVELPRPIKFMMTATSKIMTRSSYWI